MHLRNLWIIVLTQDFLHVLLQWFDEGSVSLKLRISFSKNWSDFASEFSYSRLNTIEKQSMINLTSNSSKSYASVVLSDFKVAFIGEGEDAVFFPFLSTVFSLCIFLHNQRSISSNSLVFHTSGGISLRLVVFLLLIFFIIVLNSSFVNCPSLMSKSKSKVGDLSQGWPEGSLFNSYYTKV